MPDNLSDDLIVPDGWEFTPAGMSRDGLHALDVQAGLNEHGLIVVAGNAVELPHEMWDGSYSEWAYYRLVDVFNFASEQGQLLKELLCELDDLRPESDFDLHAAWLAYLADEGRRPPLRGAVEGGSFILDIAADTPAIWGEGQRVLHAEGEPLLLVGPQGVGKTTLIGQYALRRVGLREPDLLGLPVKADDLPVIYLALDRPRQIAKSFMRMVKDSERAELDKRVHFWAGPLPFNLMKEPDDHLLKWLTHTFGEFSTVVVDSYKDTVPGLSGEESGAKLNAVSQIVVSTGYEWVGLHHQRKAHGENKTPNTLADVYGSTWLTAGAGSVALLWGEPGDELVSLKHLKQPAEVVGPLTLMHDHASGTTTVLDVSSGNAGKREAAITKRFLDLGGAAGPELTLENLLELDVGAENSLRDSLKKLVEKRVLGYREGSGRGHPSTWKMLPVGLGSEAE